MIWNRQTKIIMNDFTLTTKINYLITLTLFRKY